MAVRGTSGYPDATFSLRLAFGVVKGYEEGATQIPPWTTMGGAFDHETAHEAKEPWKLPETWHKAQGANRDIHAVEFRVHGRHYRRQFGQPGDQPRG